MEGNNNPTPQPQGEHGENAGAGGTLLGGNAETPPQGQAGQSQAPQPQGAGAQENTVPEKYEYDVPETWDEAYKTKVEAIARENKLNNEQMKKFAEMAQNEHQAFLEQREKNMQSWVNELKQDPDFAGENYNQSVQYALMGLKHIDPKGELKSVLEESGYGSHPAVVKAMFKIGKMLDNDKIAGKGSRSSSQSPVWERMYNNQ